MLKKLIAEFIGTFVLVLGGCGAAVLTAAFPKVGIGILGVALAFGLTVLTMAYAIGHISGGHMNPAVSIGLWAGKRFPAGELLPYILAQVLGAIAGAGVLYLIASGQAGIDIPKGGFAANGYGAALTGRLLPAVRSGHRSGLDLYLPDHHPGCDRQTCPAGICPAGDWPGIDPGTPGGHPGDQHVGQPGAQHRPGALPGRLGAGAALAVLDCADYRGAAGRLAVPLLRRRGLSGLLGQ